MIKKLSILLALLFAFQFGHSQILISILLGDKLNTGKIEFGLDGGVNYSNMSGFESGKPLSTFNLGFYFDFLLKNQLYLNTGVLVKSNVGLSDLKENDVFILDPSITFSNLGTYEQRTSYFQVPVTLKYRFKNHLYVHAGPQFSFMHKAFLIFSGEQNHKTFEVKSKNKDLFATVEVAIIGGIGYKLKKGQGMNIGIKYFYGLTNVFKDNYFDSKNSSLYLAVGIPIGKAKLESKTQ